MTRSGILFVTASPSACRVSSLCGVLPKRSTRHTGWCSMRAPSRTLGRGLRDRLEESPLAIASSVACVNERLMVKRLHLRYLVVSQRSEFPFAATTGQPAPVLVKEIGTTGRTASRACPPVGPPQPETCHSAAGMLLPPASPVRRSAARIRTGTRLEVSHRRTGRSQRCHSAREHCRSQRVPSQRLAAIAGNRSPGQHARSVAQAKSLHSGLF